MSRRRRKFTAADIARIVAEYEQYAAAGSLGELAASLGRTKEVLCVTAGQLGLRKTPEQRHGKGLRGLTAEPHWQPLPARSGSWLGERPDFGRRVGRAPGADDYDLPRLRWSR